VTTTKRGTLRSELTDQIIEYQMKLRRLYIEENLMHKEIDRVIQKIEQTEKALGREIA
jgi:hypothetical protein